MNPVFTTLVPALVPARQVYSGNWWDPDSGDSWSGNGGHADFSGGYSGGTWS